MKRQKKKLKKKPKIKRTPCPNCGKFGSHFVPPCVGDPGFFICKTKEKT